MSTKFLATAGCAALFLGFASTSAAQAPVRVTPDSPPVIVTGGNDAERGPTAGVPRPAPPIALTPPRMVAATPSPLNDGSNPYWAQRNQQNEIRAGQGPASVLFLGDSITDNFQNGVGRPVWNLYFAPLGAADFAVGGIMTQQVLWQLQSGQVAAVSPKVVVLLIGTNNLAVGQSPAETAIGIAAIVNGIKSQLPQTRIVLLALLPRGQAPTDAFRAKITQVNRLIMPLADGRRVVYRDFGAAYLLRSGYIAPALLPDFLHPSMAGYQIYAAAVWPSIRALLWGV